MTLNIEGYRTDTGIGHRRILKRMPIPRYSQLNGDKLLKEERLDAIHFDALPCPEERCPSGIAVPLDFPGSTCDVTGGDSAHNAVPSTSCGEHKRNARSNISASGKIWSRAK